MKVSKKLNDHSGMDAGACIGTLFGMLCGDAATLALGVALTLPFGEFALIGAFSTIGGAAVGAAIGGYIGYKLDN